MKAWKAIVKAYEGTLLGGSPQHVSAPFERKKDAKAWLTTVMDQNEEAGREVDYEESDLMEIETPRSAVVLAPYSNGTKKKRPKGPVSARTIGRSGI